MAQPRGFEVLGKEELVYKLIKALYGLKQARRFWYGRLDSWFQTQGFQRSQTEHTLYKKIEKDGNMLVDCVYGWFHLHGVIFVSSWKKHVEDV